MSNRVFGYVRVSTKNQCEDRQLIAMREYGVPERNIVVEKQSGKDFDRPRYQKLMHRLKRGDTLIVKSLDRLGRDYLEIQEQWRIISKEKGVAIIVLDMPLLNTKEHAELIGQLITDLVLQLFSFVAQTERENIHKRQREGIEAARARGVKFGRPRMVLPENFAEIVAQWRRGDFTAQEAAEKLGVSRSTFFRRVRELERERSAENLSAMARHCRTRRRKAHPQASLRSTPDYQHGHEAPRSQNTPPLSPTLLALPPHLPDGEIKKLIINRSQPRQTVIYCPKRV